HPRSSPAKEPLLSLIKQGRAFGVSVFLSTQNPYDIDYRALGNARLWVIGRLQTSNDRKRVLEGVREASSLSINAERLGDVLASLKPREFAVYDAVRGSLDIVRTRDTYSKLAGPLTLEQVLEKIRTAPSETQASTPVKDNLLLLPPQVEGLEEYFIRGQKHSEIIKELERRGLKVKSIVSAYYEPLLVVEAKLSFTGSRGSLHVIRLVELAHLAEKPSFLEASGLGLKTGELESLPLDSSPTSGYRFMAPSFPLDEKSIEGILERFKDELEKTNYRLYECVETGEISARALLAAEIFVQIADALAAIHDKDYAHGDVKPGNILFSRDRIPRLADFNSARAIAVASRSEVPYTLGYASPEQLRDKKPSKEGDVWSLALTIYETVTGKPLIPVEQYKETVLSLDSVPEVNTGDKDLDEILSKCLKLNPKERPTMKELRDMLASYIQGKSLHLNTRQTL
ncbi:MAG: protein kinase, partial [Thermofilum sp.]|nr:protein kinase [Thermofilum sp.]